MVGQLHFVLPGDPMTLTGGYLYDRCMVEGLRALGWDVTVHSLDPGFPRPDQTGLDEARKILNAIPAQCLVVIDGLALGGMPALIEEQTHRLNLLALIHHPLAAETGLDKNTARCLFVSERRALAAVRHVIVTSATSARGLSGYGVAQERIAIVVPGTAQVSRTLGSGSSALNLLCVATLIPRKGHQTLLSALALVADRPWRLCCIGSLERNTTTVTAVRRQISRLGFQDRVTLLGEIEEQGLRQHYMTSDVFVLASHLEGYGMVLSEALSHGLPIVATTAGAIPETVALGAGILVSPDDVDALGEALANVIDDSSLRNRMAQASWMAGRELPTWHQASRAFANAIETAMGL